MTIQDCLDIVDEMKPNMMSRALKVRYLSEIERLIWEEIISKHWPGKREPVPAGNHGIDPLERTAAEAGVIVPEERQAPVYTEESDFSTALQIPDPYAMVYVYWLMSKIDIQNQEDARYNIDRQHFENAYDTMSDWWTREHMPVSRVREFRL